MDDEDASFSADGDGQRVAKRRRVSLRDEDVEGPAKSHPDGSSCQSCRKKKAKCSRQQPCSVCVKYRTECVYDDTRSKPGLRTGAIESISQRVASLEQMFLGQSMLWQQLWSGLTSDSNTHQDLSSKNLNSNSNASSLKGHIEQVKSNLLHLASVHSPRSAPSSEPVQSPRKRPRPAETDIAGHGPGAIEYDEADLPPKDLVDDLVEIYFAKIHPWIPMLHVRVFRQRMANDRERTRLTTIFHAIVSLCARFSDDTRLGSAEKKARDAKKSKQTVLLRSMESFSVENLQALIICAFDTLGTGRGPSSWSIISSMTRTVEQLQLSVEEDDQPTTASGKVMIKRIAFLPPARSWNEREERRRVFWNVFLMDRFCSIATGWNFSLTSADVKMRLPCEGALWEAGQPLAIPAPYFGIADQKSSANGAFPVARYREDSQDSIGGFAYCIESTENLSLVTSFFLQQTIDVSKVHEVQVWLMKFKQLDLRLIQWKLYLPEQWREACVLNQDGNMDPNLTLAHVSHNTAVVLLHQNIAYPVSDWQSSQIRLPSASSSETCVAAAIEVAIIAEKFLQGSMSPANPQFAFCLFICGRMLLAHSSYYEIPLLKEFDSLIASLLEMSSRWTYAAPNGTDNLASKFATRLRYAQRQGPGTVDIRQPAYSDDSRLGQDQELDASILSPAQTDPILDSHPRGAQTDTSPDSITLAFPPLPLAFQPDHSGRIPTAGLSPNIPNNGGSITFETPNMLDFEDINTYLQQQFLPTERISMFSEPMHSQRPT
ncbi:fungal-specific transcription factor domain-containing protein [Hypoxylon rubiginosum]|uniref:Fungal-specific transcription factor domain-containing protein n=1 Tax=Hypoxylon rubiginosum TaxID=110542 RepID=A0ACB9ZD56_9PEZI|nr:fungal-specific transcription factor domain-containing protein [Hypoxylon rubiginosum]